MPETEQKRPSRTADPWAFSYPVVVGVVGHREIPEEDAEKIAEAIREVVSEIGKALNGGPVVVLNSLAEGADQLVARVVEKEQPHWSLWVPLPFDEQ